MGARPVIDCCLCGRPIPKQGKVYIMSGSDDKGRPFALMFWCLECGPTVEMVGTDGWVQHPAILDLDELRATDPGRLPLLRRIWWHLCHPGSQLGVLWDRYVAWRAKRMGFFDR